MRFASSVENPATRAGLGDGTSGTTNINTKDPFLWVTPQSEAAGSQYIYKSIFLRYTEAGGWGTYSRGEDIEAVNTPLTLLWKNKTTKVDVVASNFGGDPSNRVDLPASTNLVVNVQQHTDSEAVDFSDKLYFKGTIDPSANADVTTSGTTTYALDANGKIRLPLKHICSKLNITLTLGNEFSMDGGLGRGTNPITVMTVGKMYNTDNFNMTTGAFFGTYKDSNNKDAQPKDITPFSTGWKAATSATTKATATYECILIPQTVAMGNFTVSFKIGDKAYSWTSAAAGVTLESGKQYALALTAGKDVVQTGSFTAAAWSEGTGSGLETE